MKALLHCSYNVPIPSLKRSASASVPGGEEGAFWCKERGTPSESRPRPLQAVKGVSVHEGLPGPEICPRGSDHHPAAVRTVSVSGADGGDAAGRPQLLPAQRGHAHAFADAAQACAAVVPLGLGWLPGSRVHIEMLFHRPLVNGTVLLREGAAAVLHGEGGAGKGTPPCSPAGGGCDGKGTPACSPGTGGGGGVGKGTPVCSTVGGGGTPWGSERGEEVSFEKGLA